MRGAARAASCLSTLRQMGPAFNAYATDHRGRFPLSFDDTDAPDNCWWYHLAPYLGQEIRYSWSSVRQALLPGGPLACPAADPQDPEYSTPWITYKMTRAHRDWLAANGGWSKSTLGLPANLIVNPAQSLLAADGRSEPQFSRPVASPRLNGLAYSHRGKANALFADGHVASYTEAEMTAHWDRFYTHAVQ